MDQPTNRVGECNRCGDCCRGSDPFSQLPAAKCSKLIDGEVTTCTLRGTDDPYWCNACRDFPTHPDMIKGLPRCSFKFVINGIPSGTI